MKKINITSDVESRRRIAERRPAPVVQPVTPEPYAPSQTILQPEDDLLDAHAEPALSGRRKAKGNL